jgi:dienelactone hydrolase
LEIPLDDNKEDNERDIIKRQISIYRTTPNSEKGTPEISVDDTSMEDPTASTHMIKGDLVVPLNVKGLVVFAHGSGSGRKSPRNQLISRIFNDGGIATLLIDLLTETEEKVDLQTREFRFDIPLLIDRIVTTIDFVKQYDNVKDLELGLFGSSTGAAAAIVAADKRSENISAVVLRGGRVDLAYKYCKVKQLRTPILLLVGGNDPVTLKINYKLLDDLKELEPNHKKMSVIPGASHLFEEQGKLEQVSRMAASWFKEHFKQ